MPMIALTRPVPPSMANCELTHLSRCSLDIPRAAAQHAAYEGILRSLGVEVRQLPPAPELPDSVFIEDAAVVLPEMAILTLPGAVSRRPELAAVRQALAPLRPLVAVQPPGTVDGGDVLVVPQTRRIFIGLSSRTNEVGIAQMRDFTRSHGYRVEAIPMRDCLHLKSAACQIAPNDQPPLLLINPRWLPTDAFPGIACLPIHPSEPYAANAIRVGAALLHGAQFPLTRHLLHLHGIAATPVENDELAKAEGALTCCSILFDGHAAG
jgi:dimethylargininase